MKLLATIFLLLSVSLWAQNSVTPRLSGSISENLYISFEYGFNKANTDYSNSQTENGFKGIVEYFRRNKYSVGYGIKGFAGKQFLSGNDRARTYTNFSSENFKFGAAGILSYSFNEFTPYLSAGISYLIYDIELKNSKAIFKYTNRKAFSFDTELGIKFPVYKGILLNLNAGISFIPNDNLENIIDDASNDNIMSGSIGISIPIFKKKDADGDGIPDSKDPCRNQAEDFDGFQDEDGCPDLDNDYDGVTDTEDNCPNVPEDIDGFEDEDGCPEYDNDGDGIFDSNDECPDEAEDFDGFQDGDGCADLDNDGDGILDVDDICPYDAEDFDGYRDNDGCPDLDNDGDGIPDTRDRCPNSPETFNDFEDEDGCPDTKPVPEEEPNQNLNRENDPPQQNQNENRVEPSTGNEEPVIEESGSAADISKGDIVLLSEFIFVKDEAKINPKALWQLNKVVKLIQSYPDSKWRIEGFDNSPKTGKNLNLTAERARALSEFLKSRGLNKTEFQLIDKSKSVSTSSSKISDKKMVIKKVK